MEKTKVLFVDDDIALGQVVILALRASGYAAEYCTTLVGIQGVVQEMQPDIMVLDVEWNRCRCGTQADGSRYTGFICLFTHSRFGSGKGAGCRWHRLSAKAFRNGGVGGLHTQAHAMFSSERTIHRNVQSESRRQYVVQRRGTCEKAD